MTILSINAYAKEHDDNNDVWNASWKNISINDAYATVVEKLGKPLKASELSDRIVFRYSSIGPTKANFIHLQNENVAMKSTSLIDDSRYLRDYIERHGLPEISIKKYSDELQDSFRTTVHIWPDDGVAVFTYGLDVRSQVVRIHEFAPLSIDEYFKTWGKKWKGNKEVTITGDLSLTSTQSKQSTTVFSKTNQFFADSKIEIITIGVVLVAIVIAVVLVTAYLKRSKIS